MLSLRPLCAGVFLLGSLSGSAAFAADSPLADGDWVQIKGQFAGGLFLIREIERLDAPESSVKGPIERFDPLTGELVFGALRLVVDDRTRIDAVDGSPLDVERLSAGSRVKVSLREQDDGSFRVRRIRLLEESTSERLRFEGRVGHLSHLEKETYFALLGLEVRADAKTSWSGIARPRYFVDDEDRRPARGIGLGRLGRLSGEIRLDLKGEDNFNLADTIDADEATGRLRGRIEWIFPTTRRFSGMLQLKSEEEREIVDDADQIEDTSETTLGRAYVILHSVLGKRGSVQIGRSRFDDNRDWLFNRDIDALRLFFDWSKLRLEASFAEELVDPVPRHRDVANAYLAATVYPARKHSITAYLFDRDDSREINGSPRDFSPQHRGLRAEGEGKYWSYWFDGALARGHDRGLPLEAHAVDAGVTWIAPLAVEPSITVAYAMGSGDDDPLDGVSGTFRQTGLQLNNGKFNGVSSFRHYGELMRPELANLHVETYGIGLRPKKKTSLDVIYHRYELDEPASQLVDAAMDDRTLNLIDLDIGTEWDLVFGYEELRHWEFEIDLGYFIPGDAFLGPTDDAGTARFKVKYIF
jgi:alginate production protein